MNRRAELRRTTPLVARSPLLRHTPLVAKASTSKTRRRYTGPPKKVRDLVDERSGGVCEWPECGHLAVDRHHRLNRKSGGRHGEMAVRINSAAWLLAACRHHHDLVTNPYGEALRLARDWGWLLHEGEDAPAEYVTTCHDPMPILLDNAGGWTTFEESA